MLILDPKGLIASDEKTLLITAVCLLLIIVIPVIILTFVIAIKYRASNKKAKYTPDWCHNNTLEAAWWVAPIVICGILGTIIWITTQKLDPYRPLDSKVKPIQVQVISLQWRWLFIYPEQGIATINQLEFPVDTPINFTLTADSPMNSFQIAQLGGQIYSMNGMKTQLHLIANEKGVYSGRSVNFSGDGFEAMMFDTTVTTQEEFDNWVKKIKQTSKSLDVKEYKQLAKPNQNESVVYYSSIQKGIFDLVIMQFMDPKVHELFNGDSTIKNIDYK